MVNTVSAIASSIDQSVSEAYTHCFLTSVNGISSGMSKTTLKRQCCIMDSIIAGITYVTSVLLILLIIF